MKNQNKKHFGITNAVLLMVLAVYTFFLAILILWGAITSLKTLDDFYGNKLWLPSGWITTWGWDNFPYVLQNFVVKAKDVHGRMIQINILGQAINTVLYTIGASFVKTACCCLVAYLCAKFNYFFSKVLYTVVLITMVVPILGSTPSMLLFLKQTNLYDNWIGTYIMNFTFLGLYFLIFHGIFEGLSPEYSEAARIDGANEYQIFFRIMFPLVTTTFYTVFLITFIGNWNDYNTALMFMPTHPTLAYGVYYLSISNEPGLSFAPMRMVACVILATPLIVIFVAFRDKLIGNSTMGGVKE